MNEDYKEPKDKPGKTLVMVDALKPGMVLAEDLRHFNGRLILKQGASLTPRDLRIVKMWGITEAEIQTTDIPPKEKAKAEPGAEKVKEAEALAEELFRFTHLEHPFIGELQRLFIQRYPGLQPPVKESRRSESSLPQEEAAPIDIRQEIEKGIRLPSLPSVVVKINQAINNPNCTATHIADIISKDSGLTARLLKLVNSAFYNFPMPIESIPRAVTIIGSKQLSALAVATAVISTFESIPSEVIDMKSFWKHSVACGIICRLISGYKRNANTESYFLAGLLHDIGRLIIYQYFPMEAGALILRARSQPELLHKLEASALGSDHAELGSLLIEKWQLPPILEHACHYHHVPLESPEKTVSCIVHTADIVSNALQFGSSGEYYVPPLKPGAWDGIGLPVSVLARIVQQTDIILSETIHTYLNHE